jgi:hypothetical protein
MVSIAGKNLTSSLDGLTFFDRIELVGDLALIQAA